ncbi:MAG: glycosyltransferase [Lachnospiraceae bacterium]|nr:glycosyltransferase [Lachnospiraceae bacterium]MDE6982412.1 glycosyltransferase [Lachnospiraceae bacterium]
MNIKYQYNYVKSLLKRYGLKGLVLKTLERSRSPMLSYTDVYQRYLAGEEELNRQREDVLSFAPLVSIVIPAYETGEVYLRELLDSLTAQTYGNWELCLADGSKSCSVESVVKEYQMKENRIHYKRLTKNGGISENTNAGFEMAAGEFVALMDHDDVLAPGALYEMVKCLNEVPYDQRNLAMIYSDEDKIDSEGKVHSRPHFKPDFNLEFLRRNNYICHFLMFSRELLHKTGGLNPDFDGAQDYDFVLRCVEAGAYVGHVPKILYHWRIHEGSTAGNSADKEYAFDNGCKAIEGHLSRMGTPGRARVTPNLGVYQVSYERKGVYQVSVIAASRETLAYIKRQITPYLTGEGYKIKTEYLLADRLKKDILNRAKGDYIFWAGEHVTIPGDALVKLLSICGAGQNGIVGAKILDTKKRVLSNGYIYDREGHLIPSLKGLYGGFKGYFLHGVIPKWVSAVSFSCVVIKRKALEMAEEDLRFTGEYYGADLSFSMRRAGFFTVVTPEVSVILKSREKGGLNQEERKIFSRKWEKELSRPDPCYNRNLKLKTGYTYEMRE